LAAERCNKLILACPGNLLQIFATIPGIAQIREAGKIGVAEFDTYVPLLSLPRVFGTTLDTIPASLPYVDVDMLRRRKDNASLILPATPFPRIGMVWAGSPHNRTDRHRSCPLREFLPILRTPGVTFYSLQKGDRHKALTDLPLDIQVQDLEPQLGDFGDLAVIIDELDLVISVDTSVAHMAGALGKPVWTLLSHVADWHWMLEGETTPWYPTMRLFRQSRPGDWGGIMERVAHALQNEEWRSTRFKQSGGGRKKWPDEMTRAAN
jgi:hypothetical protein